MLNRQTLCIFYLTKEANVPYREVDVDYVSK